MANNNVTLNLLGMKKWTAVSSVVKDMLVDNDIPKRYKERLMDAYNVKEDYVDIAGIATEVKGDA